MRAPPVIGFLFLCVAILPGCSSAIMTIGVLDAAEQRALRASETRSEFEAVVGGPDASRTTSDGGAVVLYSYVDGEAPVWGRRGGSFSDGRGLHTALTALSLGMLEPAMVPTAMAARSQATREIYVIYDADGRILAICPPKVTSAAPLCDAEAAPKTNSRLDK